MLVPSLNTGRQDVVYLQGVQDLLLGKALLYCAVQLAHQAFTGPHMQYQLAPPHLHSLHHSHFMPNTAQHSMTQHSTAQHSTAQHSTAQHRTAQHGTACVRHARGGSMFLLQNMSLMMCQPAFKHDLHISQLRQHKIAQHEIHSTPPKQWCML